MSTPENSKPVDLWHIYQEIGQSNAAKEMTPYELMAFIARLRTAAQQLEATLPKVEKLGQVTEHMIRGGDMVYVKCTHDRAISELDALWSVQMELLEAIGRDSVFVISAPSYDAVVSLLLPVLGMEHDDYAGSRWSVEAIGLDARNDTSNKYILSTGVW